MPRSDWHRRVIAPGTRWAGFIPIVLAVLTAWAQQWFLLIVPVILLVLLLRTIVDVRIDDTGLTARALLGRPRLHVPIADIVGAEARSQVSPMSEFSGYGWRTSPGGTRGVVVREGEALVVDRRDASPLVITVDDADEAADLLNAAVRAIGGR